MLTGICQAWITNPYLNWFNYPTHRWFSKLPTLSLLNKCYKWTTYELIKIFKNANAHFHILREEKIKLKTIIEFHKGFLLYFCLLRLMTSRDIPNDYPSLNISLFLQSSCNSFCTEKTQCVLWLLQNFRIISKAHLGLWILLRLDSWIFKQY